MSRVVCITIQTGQIPANAFVIFQSGWGKRPGLTNYEVEYYILAQDRIQVELLCNVEQCPKE